MPARPYIRPTDRITDKPWRLKPGADTRGRRAIIADLETGARVIARVEPLVTDEGAGWLVTRDRQRDLAAGLMAEAPRLLAAARAALAATWYMVEAHQDGRHDIGTNARIIGAIERLGKAIERIDARTE